MTLKDALGYNTLLPAGKQTLEVDGYFQHLRNPQSIQQFAETLGDKRKNFRVCSFGDEISLGRINFADPKYIEPFRAWLKQKKLTAAEIRMPLEKSDVGWQQPSEVVRQLVQCRTAIRPLSLVDGDGEEGFWTTSSHRSELLAAPRCDVLRQSSAMDRCV